MSKLENLKKYEILKLIETKDKHTISYFKKNISTYIDVIIKLTNVDTNESEYYISDRVWQILNNNEVFKNLEIAKSKEMIDLPFDLEYEKEVCGRLNMDCNELSSRFVDQTTKHSNGFKVYDENLLDILLMFKPLTIEYKMKNI